MKRVNNNIDTTEQLLNALQTAFAMYYMEAVSRNIKAGIQAKKLSLQCQAK